MSEELYRHGPNTDWTGVCIVYIGPQGDQRYAHHPDWPIRAETPSGNFLSPKDLDRLIAERSWVRHAPELEMEEGL